MSRPAASAVRAWRGSWRIALVMAWADARRHRLRTVLATLLVAIPVAGLILSAAVLIGDPPPRAAALRGLPTGAQGLVVSLARPATAPAVEQSPELIPLVVPDATVVPAAPSLLIAALPKSATLTPYWTSTDLLAAGVKLDPFAAGVAAPESVVALRLREADPALIARLVPAPSAGVLPTKPGQVAVSRTVAQRLALDVGGPMTIVGQPPTGWMGTAGPVDQLVAGTSRTFTVTAIIDSEATMAWSTPGWLSAAVEAKPGGILRSYVVDGPDPVTWAQVKELNLVQAAAISRHVLEHYPAAAELYPVRIPPSQLATLVFGIVVAGVVGLAGLLFLVTPAFTVSAEQSRRSLALASAAGGEDCRPETYGACAGTVRRSARRSPGGGCRHRRGTCAECLAASR